MSDGASAEPLGSRLFKARLEVIAELDSKFAQSARVGEKPVAYGEDLSEEPLRMDTAALLHQMVAAMRVDNFVVRPQRLHVERFAKASAWDVLTPEDHHALCAHVAGLPSELGDADKDDKDGEEARRFDMLVLRTQPAILQAKPDFASLKDRMQAIASALEEQANIPAIKAEIVFIQTITDDAWWEDVTTVMLETARRKLRSLVKRSSLTPICIPKSRWAFFRRPRCWKSSEF